MVMVSRSVPRFQFFTREQCGFIHNASLDILRRTGVRVHHPEALSLLRKAGAVIRSKNRVFMPADLVEWALSNIPARLVLCKRGRAETFLPMEPGAVHFGTGSDCAHYLDPETGTNRVFTVKEIADCVRLVDALPEIDFCMSMGSPADVPPADRNRVQFALMLENSEKPIVFVAADRLDCEFIHAMASVAAGGEDALRLNPFILCYSQVTSPLVQPREALDKLLFTAEKAIPVVHQPAPMMGGTAPVTLAGGIALGNAEVLSSALIHQLRRPGAPFVYGCGLHHMDMKTTISVYNAPEWLLARAAAADMARFYGLPRFGYAGHTDSNTLDEQAAADAVSTIQFAFLTGEHLAHDVGYMESGLTTSPELIVFSDEVISMMRVFAKGISFDAESTALDVIEEVGPGGNFLTTKHTMAHFREFWQPRLFNRDRRDSWVQKGAPTLGDRLREKTLSLIRSHRPNPMPESVVQRIDEILKETPSRRNGRVFATGYTEIERGRGKT